MLINRTFIHKTFGEIGSVELTVPDGDWKLDGETLPASSVLHLLGYSCQSFQDAYAGAKTVDEATADFAKKRDKIAAGTLGTRGGSGSVDTFTATARRIVHAFLKTHWGKDSKEWADYTGLSDADQDARCDTVYADNEAVFKPQVETAIANAKAERERKAALKNITIKL